MSIFDEVEDDFEKAVQKEARTEARKGAPVAEKDAEASEAAAIGLTKDELLAARESYLRMWPQAAPERR